MVKSCVKARARNNYCGAYLNRIEQSSMKIKLSFIFYALSDPIRLEIIRTLSAVEELPCSACKSSLSKSTMSHHFKVLREAGLIQKRTLGKVHFISLRHKQFEKRLPGLLDSIQIAKRPF